MRKFGRDLLEVGKDIAYGAFYVFRAFVIFFWWLGVVTEEKCTRLVKYIKAKRKKTIQGTGDIEITVFSNKEKALSCN